MHSASCRTGASADVDAADKTFKATPLHMAVRAGHPAAVKALLDGGASRAARDKYGKTALDYAVDSGNAEISALLRRRVAGK